MTVTEPITLDEAKAHLRVEFADDDAYISALITAAREYAEAFQNRLIAARSYGEGETTPEGETVELAGAMERQAMLLLIGHWYANREAVTVGASGSEVPLAATELLYFNRRWPV